MNKKTLYLIGIFLTMAIGSWLYYIFSNNSPITLENDKQKVIEESTSSNVTKNPFLITDGTFKAEALDNFNFRKSSFSVLPPVSTSVSDALEKLKEYLLVNPSKLVDISGMYTAKENNTSELDNLGLARANSVKDYLVSFGISADKINISSELNNALIADGDHLFGPLTFKINDLGNPENEMYEKIKGTSFTLHFETGKSSIKLSVEQHKKMEEFSKAAKFLGLKISITGHTDNTGRRTFNNNLGKKRAEFVKNQLLKNDSKNQIETSTQGEDNPIASNSEEAGRAKNRRVIITINQ